MDIILSDPATQPQTKSNIVYNCEKWISIIRDMKIESGAGPINRARFNVTDSHSVVFMLVILEETRVSNS